jgi:ADP-ribosylglycohydrolase
MSTAVSSDSRCASVPAEWAWRDAAVSHTRNGLYGAMFVAAMASEAIHGSDIATVLDVGTSVVPPTAGWPAPLRSAGSSAGRAVSRPRRTPHSRRSSPVCTGSTASTTPRVAYALEAGAGDFDRSMALTVMGEWDTDSNGATVGAVAGALAGATALAPRWTDPLHGRLVTSIPDAGDLPFDALPQRTLAVADSVRGAGAS